MTARSGEAEKFGRPPNGLNNPVKYVDPSGHIPCEECGLTDKNTRPIIPRLHVYYAQPSGFSTTEERLIERALKNWGKLIGPERFSELVDQGARADGHIGYLLTDGGSGKGAGHYDRLGKVELGDTVFASGNWKTRYRPDPGYQKTDISARISNEL
jgi:hypothetical protein